MKTDLIEKQETNVSLATILKLAEGFIPLRLSNLTLNSAYVKLLVYRSTNVLSITESLACSVILYIIDYQVMLGESVSVEVINYYFGKIVSQYNRLLIEIEGGVL